MKRSNVSIFVPFAGCPNRCSFCDQHKITGVVSSTTPVDVKKAIETALSSNGIDIKNSEIAFFGGSFTAIDREYMCSLLEATREYLRFFKGIRVSTRPDCIDDDLVYLLKTYGVSAIELGAQSMCDDVLSLNDRGHTSGDVRISSEIIKKHGLSLGLQMMTGLYGSDSSKDVYTAQEFLKLSPDTVRIYPTVTLKGTKLHKLYNEGVYVPDSLEDTISLCSELIMLFERNNIKIIRLGLHSSDTLEENIVAGAFHPALGELCESRIFLNIMRNSLESFPKNQRVYNINVAKSAVSKAIGQHRCNINKLKEDGYNVKIIADESLFGRQIKIQEG